MAESITPRASFNERLRPFVVFSQNRFMKDFRHQVGPRLIAKPVNMIRILELAFDSQTEVHGLDGPARTHR